MRYRWQRYLICHCGRPTSFNKISPDLYLLLLPLYMAYHPNLKCRNDILKGYWFLEAADRVFLSSESLSRQERWIPLFASLWQDINVNMTPIFAGVILTSQPWQFSAVLRDIEVERENPINASTLSISFCLLTTSFRHFKVTPTHTQAGETHSLPVDDHAENHITNKYLMTYLPYMSTNIYHISLVFWVWH